MLTRLLRFHLGFLRPPDHLHELFLPITVPPRSYIAEVLRALHAQLLANVEVL